MASQTAPSPVINPSGAASSSARTTASTRISAPAATSGPVRGEAKDAISTGDDTSNNVLDHVSADWGRDETLSLGDRSQERTVANCLVAEGLIDPAENANGSPVGNDADRVAIMGTVYVADRPLDDDQPLVGEAATQPDARPLCPAEHTAMPSGEVEAHNRRYAGARPADRDAHDTRLVDEIDTRSGEFVGHQSGVGGYGSLPITTHSLAVPGEGLRSWLEAWALAIEDPAATSP